MSIPTGTRLGPHTKERCIVLDWSVGRKFRLWLDCGHPGGEAAAGGTVSRRRCHACGAFRHVARVEPVL